MSEMINSRTAEDIKSALSRCGTYQRCHSEENDDCPYYVDCLIGIHRMKLIKDALALIKRLETERDSLKKAFDEALELNAVQAKSIKVLSSSKRMQWISVKERFPEKGDKVLISLCGCNVKEARYCGDGIFEAAYAETYHATRTGAIVLTHWMPMPEPVET